jgi:hypothetical protein
VVGQDGVDDVESVWTGAAGRSVGAREFGVAVLAIAVSSLVKVGRVGVSAAGHRDVKLGAGGVFAKHGVGSVGG